MALLGFAGISCIYIYPSFLILLGPATTCYFSHGKSGAQKYKPNYASIVKVSAHVMSTNIQWPEQSQYQRGGKYILPIVGGQYKVTWQTVWMYNPTTGEDLGPIIQSASSWEWALRECESHWARREGDKERRWTMMHGAQCSRSGTKQQEGPD